MGWIKNNDLNLIGKSPKAWEKGHEENKAQKAAKQATKDAKKGK